MKKSILCAFIVLGISASYAGLEVQGEPIKKATPKKKLKTKKTQPSAKVTVETYPALEEIAYDDEPVVEIGTKPVAVTSPTVVELDSLSKTKAMEERIALLEKKLGNTVSTSNLSTPAPAAPVASPRVQSPSAAVVANEKFFMVAPDRRDQIIARLKLIESLIRESGRAYDYRAMTTSQLESELVAVRSTSKPKLAPLPPAPKADGESSTPGDVLKIIFSE